MRSKIVKMISLKDDSDKLALLVRLVAVVHLTYGVYYDFFCLNPPPEFRVYTLGGKFKYMTNWNLVREIICYLFVFSWVWFRILIDSVCRLTRVEYLLLNYFPRLVPISGLFGFRTEKRRGVFSVIDFWMRVGITVSNVEHTFFYFLMYISHQVNTRQ